MVAILKNGSHIEILRGLRFPKGDPYSVVCQI